MLRPHSSFIPREIIMKILIADKFSENHLDRLKNLGCDVTYNAAVKAEDLPKLIAPYQVLVVRSKQVSADTIKAGDQLAVIIRAGAGVNTIDVKAASARGVYVTNCPGKNSVAVAELVFTLILGLDRRLADNVAALRAHKWNKKEFSKADGLLGKTLGIIGVGQIGREVIKRAHAFGLPVIAWSRSLNLQKARDLGVEYCPDLDTLFRRSDIISLHVALKPDTKKLVNAKRLALMKPNAILINTARGEVIDQPALAAALAAKKIRAGLDVFDPEPADATGEFADPILDHPHLRDLRQNRRHPQLRQPRHPHPRQVAAHRPPLRPRRCARPCHGPDPPRQHQQRRSPKHHLRRRRRRLLPHPTQHRTHRSPPSRHQDQPRHHQRRIPKVVRVVGRARPDR